MLRALTRRLLRKPGLVVALALLSAGPTGWFSVQLFGDVRADLRELLPQETPSVKTLHELERRFGGWSELLVLIESPDKEANRRFSDDLSARMKTLEVFRTVENRLGEGGKFFSERRHLFVDKDDLEEILERIEDAAHQARVKANPLIVELEEQEPVKLDFSDIEAKYEARLDLIGRFPNDYFENKEGTQLVILARKRGLAFGVDENRRVAGLVEGAINELDPSKYHSELTAKIGGDVKNIVDEHGSLIEDLALASLIVGVLLALVVIGYFRRLRSLYLIAIPLLVGCTWTFALGHFVVGYLNASSAFLGPIVPGNGINFGLILLARYFEERRAGRQVEESIEDAVIFTAKATSTAALAASIAYGSLMATDFLGFKHFGVIGGLGMVLCWIATFLVLPPLIFLVERKWPLKEKGWLLWQPGTLSEIPSKIVARAAWPLAVLGVLTAVVSVVISARYLEDPFEKDFHKLRSTVSFESGTAAITTKVDAIFARVTTPQVVMADSADDVPDIVDHLEKVIKNSTGTPYLSDVAALITLVPPDQEDKIEILEEIREVLSDDLLESLDEKERRLALKHRPPEGLKPFTAKDLPDSIRQNFSELDGQEGRIVLVTPNIEHNLFHADVITAIAEILRDIPLSSGRKARSSGNFAIYADMLDVVSSDGPKATFYAFGGLLILCLLAYRRASSTLIVSGSLLLGVSWLGAVLDTYDININFLNFIALPITFGIGVDYAVNIYTRYTIERTKRDTVDAVQEAIRSTGGAVVLCSLTTIIGYGSLLIARNGALVSFGKVAVIGEFTCLAAALLVMPAWICVFTIRKKQAQ